ncbi:hypothetical protein BCR36DRAFT_333611 [Piromyces finnis]|uniref:ABC transporter domain-containing protein n=1 Tax=Piromyces finnis TaxID=1754191 RepID=A0A1Y1V2X7_9FUNG|nr:hypothetical protein BCR36DRAFT_333611 [Piromyces finnis]|eukprot:ORX45239.1 hypothetical protein BCR36DRAFT_333611 [Piromyces finnis]
MNNRKILQLKTLIWRNLIYKKRNKLSTFLEIIVPTIILLLLYYVSEKDGIVIDVLEVNSDQYNFNDLNDIQYSDVYFGFVFPENFEKKEEFINNFKSLDAIKNNNSVVDGFDINFIKRDGNISYQNDANIFFNPNNLKHIEAKVLNADLLLKAKYNENSFNNSLSNIVINNELIQENDIHYYNDFQTTYDKIKQEYESKYENTYIISYDYNKPQSYSYFEKKKVHIKVFKNKEEMQKIRRYNFFGIVFTSQTQYTVKKFDYIDIGDFIKPKYTKDYEHNTYALTEIKKYALAQKLVDQVLIKTLTGYDYNINLHDQTMDQEEIIYEYGDNPANNYLPYLILFFFIPCITNLFLFLVIEKETKFKNSLAAIGLDKNLFWLSWGIIYALIIGIASFLTFIILLFSNVFSFSVNIVCFLLIFIYGLSNCFMVFGISTFIMKSRTSLITGVLFVIGLFIFFFIYYAIKSSVSLLIIFGIFLSPISLLSSINRLSNLKSTILDFNIIDVFKDGQMYGFIFGLVFSCIFYLLLAIYLDNVVPQGNALNKKWNYIFKKAKESDDPIEEMRNKKEANSSFIEPDPENREKIVEVNSVYKFFTIDKKRFCALNDINFNVYLNEIFAIIGHNGAGKSTLMNIMTGMYYESSGSITYNGKNFKNNRSEICSDIGYCAQYNVYTNYLTILEHLKLFCGIKNINEDYDKVLKDIGLLQYKNDFPSILSGGQKRLLNVAFAFLGKPKYVFLDEPSTGLDPLTRKKVWEYLLKKKQNSTVFLTTHYMDEADVLTDRKLIISNGTICCLGSSLFLKNAYNMSYSFDIIIDENKNNEIKKIFNNYIPNVNVTENHTTNNQKMYTYYIPMSNSDSFSKALTEVNKIIEGDEDCKGYTLTSPSLEELFVKLETSKESNSISIKKNALTEKMRKKYNQDRNGSSDNIKQIWSFIKLRLKLFLRNKVAAINTMFFPLAITILCLIGAKYIKDQTNKPRVISYKNIDISNKIYDNKIKWFVESNSDDKGRDLFSNLDIDKSLLSENLNYNKELSLSSGKANEMNDYIGGFLGYMEDNIYKITLYNNVNMMYSLPLSINLLSNAIISKYNDNIIIKTSYQPIDDVFEIYESSDDDKDNLNSQNLTNLIIEYVLVAEIGVMFSLLISLYGPTLVKEREENITQQLYLNGMKNLNYWIGVICSDLICVFISITLVTIFGIITDLSIFYYKGLLFTIVLLILCSISSLLYQYVINYFFEKYDKASTFSSIFNPVLTLILCLISIYAVLKESDTNLKWSFYLIYILPMIFFAPSAIPTMLFKIVYITSYKMYDNKYDAFLQSDIYQELLNNRDDDDYNKKLNNAFKKFSFPSLHEFFSTKYRLYYILIILVLSIILYISVIFILERIRYNKKRSIKKWDENERKKQDSLLSEGPEDVLYEWKRVCNSINNPESEDNKVVSMKVHELRKDYKYQAIKNIKNKCDTTEKENKSNIIDERIYKSSNGKQFKRVIDDLTFGVNYGECLGLLGPNGTGKTTTISIISCSKNPSLGQVIYGNKSLANYNLFDLGIGICPQFDALWNVLTVKEHIEFYYSMCGYSKQDVKEIVSSLVDYCGIESHINKKVCEVSGGTKRKLSLIVSLCSSPSYLLLDEPTAGIDPFTRRYIWNLISEFKEIQQTATILTTHSTEEAEYLCDRIAILMKGKLACIDTPKNIKMKFNNYYILDVFTDNAELFENKYVLEKNIFGLEDIKNYQLKSYVSYQKYTVQIKHDRIANIFDLLEDAKKQKIIKEYSFGQCSLEQVYINIIKKNDEQASFKADSLKQASFIEEGK